VGGPLIVIHVKGRTDRRSTAISKKAKKKEVCQSGRTEKLEGRQQATQTEREIHKEKKESRSDGEKNARSDRIEGKNRLVHIPRGRHHAKKAGSWGKSKLKILKKGKKEIEKRKLIKKTNEQDSGEGGGRGSH